MVDGERPEIVFAELFVTENGEFVIKVEKSLAVETSTLLLPPKGNVTEKLVEVAFVVLQVKGLLGQPTIVLDKGVVL